MRYAVGVADSTPPVPDAPTASGEASVSDDLSIEMSAERAIEEIKVLDDSAIVREFVTGDDRKTVADAVEARIATLGDDGSAPDPGIIPVDRIPFLQGFVPPPDTVTKTGTPLVGDESPSGKVKVRTRYPVDIFDSGTLVITAEGVKVEGSKLSGLVSKARESGVELERI